jgi:hypothetical protein
MRRQDAAARSERDFAGWLAGRLRQLLRTEDDGKKNHLIVARPGNCATSADSDSAADANNGVSAKKGMAGWEEGARAPNGVSKSEGISTRSFRRRLLLGTVFRMPPATYSKEKQS